VSVTVENRKLNCIPSGRFSDIAISECAARTVGTERVDEGEEEEEKDSFNLASLDCVGTVNLLNFVNQCN
jgi:hypothetical protein